jgi:phosphatidate cytidylyltransferase
MFRTRLISGIVLVLLLIAFIRPGGWLLWAGCLAISMIGLFELYRVFGIHNNLLGYLGYAALVVFYLDLQLHFLMTDMVLVIGILLLLLFVFVLTYPKYNASQVMQAFFGVLYVGVMLSYIFQTRRMATGVYDVWLIFFCAWGCDTCAYCTGMLFGKHKLAPILSPKKSIEGSIGGILGAAILGAIYACLLHVKYGFGTDRIGSYALICAIGAVFSQLGDLSASAIKRNYDIKDYGKLIPGHGGIMDRFDSVIVTAPMIYYLAYYLIHH